MKLLKQIKRGHIIIGLMIVALILLFYNPVESIAATKYTVKFQSQGGTGVASKKVNSKALVSAPKAPKRTGYKFGGWYKDKSLKSAWNFKTTRVTKNVTLYAKWIPNKYKITFKSNGGSSIASQSISYQGLVNVPKTPSKKGYYFAGWYQDSKLKTAWNFQSKRITKATTLYAKWSVSNNKKITYVTNGGAGIADRVIAYNSTFTLPGAQRNGYTFLGWFSDSALKKPVGASVKVTSDITLYAGWTLNSYTVNFDTGGGTYIAPQTISSGGRVAIPPTPSRTGYTFGGWCSTPNYVNGYDFSTPITRNVTVYARWNINMYTVSFDTMGGAQIPPQTIPYGGRVSAPIAFRNGFTFAAWCTSPAYVNAFDLSAPVTGNITLYAKWDLIQQNAYRAIITSSISSLNVRYSPSSVDNSNVIGTLTKGNIIDVYLCSTPGWYQINYKGQTAYIASQLSSGTVTAQLIAYAAKIKVPGEAKIYTWADINAPVVSTIKNGNYVNVIPVPENPNFVRVATTRDTLGFLLISDIQELYYNKLNIHSPSTITGDQINAVIDDYERKYNKVSVFRGKGQSFVDIGNAGGINPLILTAMAIHESGWGTSSLAKYKYNIFSVAAYDDSAYDSAYTFASVEDAIRYQVDFLNKSYITSPYSTGRYTMMGDFLGTSGLVGLQSLGEAGINAYYATGATWGAGIANLCEQILPYDANYYNSVGLMTASGLNNIALPFKDNDFSAFPNPIIGVNTGSALNLYTTLGGNVKVTDASGNPIYLAKNGISDPNNDGTFHVLHFYGNNYNGWMQVSIYYAGVNYTGFVNFGSLSGYASRFRLLNLIRNTSNWSYTTQTTQAVPSGYTSCYR